LVSLESHIFLLDPRAPPDFRINSWGLSLHISSYFLGHRIDESFFSIERFSSHILAVGAVVNLAHQFDSQQTVGSRSVEASPCYCRCLENQDISSLVAQSK
jgi:hypothetical protein